MLGLLAVCAASYCVRWASVMQGASSRCVLATLAAIADPLRPPIEKDSGR